MTGFNNISLVKSALLVSVVIVSCGAAKLPKYLTSCSRNDPELNACALKSGENGLSEFLKGDSSINVPSLLPLVVPSIGLEVGPNLKFTFTNAEFFGLDTSKLTKVNVDLKKDTLVLEVHINALQLSSQYKVDGKILILPIVGEGPSNITLTNGKYHLAAGLVYNDKKGVKYMKLDDPKLTFEVEKMSFHFENLFNGDKVLGTELNRFFTENWKEVADELHPSLELAIGEIVSSISNSFLSKVPFDNLFLP